MMQTCDLALRYPCPFMNEKQYHAKRIAMEKLAEMEFTRKRLEARHKFGVKPSKREARQGRRARKQDMREFWRLTLCFNAEIA
jgi:hypothetical protein